MIGYEEEERAGDTPPLADSSLDVRHLTWMRLDIVRLLNSTTWIKARRTGYARGAMVCLWARAWQQVPAGSLPNDNELLQEFAELHQEQFIELRPLVLSGFVLCSDNRLYHPVLVEFAKQALEVSTRASRGGKARAANMRRAAPVTSTPTSTPTTTRASVLLDVKEGSKVEPAHRLDRGRARVSGNQSEEAVRLLGELMELFDIGDRHPLALQTAEHIRTWLCDGIAGTTIYDVCKRIRDRNGSGWSPQRWSYFDKALVEAQRKTTG